jgi:hypothetical protein
MKNGMLIGVMTGLVIVIVGAAVARNVMDTTEQNLLATNKGDLGADAGFLSKYVQPYQIDEANTTNTYFRWQSGNDDVWVMRISVSGTVTTWEKATGAWTNRTSLTYEAIND